MGLWGSGVGGGWVGGGEGGRGDSNWVVGVGGDQGWTWTDDDLLHSNQNQWIDQFGATGGPKESVSSLSVG
jgi:hypothetical protein